MNPEAGRPRPPGVPHAATGALLDLLRSGNVPQLDDSGWALLLELAAHHRLTSWVAVKLNGQEGVPAPSAALLHKCRERNVMVQLKMLADVRGATASLDVAGIPHMIVKGPALAARAYDVPEEREYGDIDVLVEPVSLDAVLHQLETSGGRLLDRNWPMISRTGRGELSVLLKYGTNLDLHWSLLNTPELRGTFHLPTSSLFARGAQASFDGLVTRVLHPVDELVYVALHAGLAGAHRLSWLVDVKQLAGTVSDWAVVVRRARETGAALMLSIVFNRARHVVSADIPRDVISELAGGRAWAAPSRLVDRRLAPAWLSGGRSGRTWISSTRGDTLASARALAVVVRREIVPALRGRDVVGSSIDDLHRDVSGSDDRETFMTALRLSTQPP